VEGKVHAACLYAMSASRLCCQVHTKSTYVAQCVSEEFVPSEGISTDSPFDVQKVFSFLQSKAGR